MRSSTAARLRKSCRKPCVPQTTSNVQYEQAISMISDIIWRYDLMVNGEPVSTYISPVADRMLGLPAGTIGNSFEKYFSYVHPDDLPVVQGILSEGIRMQMTGKTAEYRLRKADGTTIWVRSRGSAYFQPDGRVTIFGTTSEITERRWAGAYREMGREVLQILNEPGDLRDSIRRVLVELKTRTGFDAVGIRLQDGDDFPYLAQEGFSKDFLLTENTLIERAADGGVCRDNRRQRQSGMYLRPDNFWQDRPGQSALHPRGKRLDERFICVPGHSARR